MRLSSLKIAEDRACAEITGNYRAPDLPRRPELPRSSATAGRGRTRQRQAATALCHVVYDDGSCRSRLPAKARDGVIHAWHALRDRSGEQGFDAYRRVAGGELRVQSCQRGVAGLGESSEVVVGPQLVTLV